MYKREVKKSLVFENTGTDFSGLYAAQKWLNDNGYSYGPTSIDGPIAIFKGVGHYVSKWRNLSPEEKNEVSGIIPNDHNHRNGSISIKLYE